MVNRTTPRFRSTKCV